MKSKIMKKTASFKVNIPVSILREDKRYVAYTPALDLSTSGKTYKEVQKRFTEIVSIFMEEIVKKGTVDEILSGLGWKKIKSENKINWISPVVVSQNTQLIEV
jgi:hypothetical protein